jgi:simple sugar transport system permease protein
MGNGIGRKRILDVAINFSPVISAFIGILIGACFVALWGVSPIMFFAELVKGALGDRLAVGSTLNNAAPLLIAGSGTAIAFRAGANNIGQEGQLFLGGLGAATVSLLIPNLPGVIGIPAIFLVSFIFGMAFASIAVLFRLLKGVNELLVTLLLNYVGTLLVAAMVNGPFRSATNVSYPQTDAFGEQFLLTNWPQFGYMHSGIFIAVAVVLVSGYFLWFTPMGLRIRNVGLSPEASRTTGSNPTAIFVVAMLISGGLSGLAGGVEVIGRSELLRQGFGASLGFDSLAVALLGDINPFAVLPAGLFFGALRTGMQTMQRSIGIPSALLDLVKGVIMISIMVGGAIKLYVRLSGVKKQKRQVEDDNVETSKEQ